MRKKIVWTGKLVFWILLHYPWIHVDETKKNCRSVVLHSLSNCYILFFPHIVFFGPSRSLSVVSSLFSLSLSILSVLFFPPFRSGRKRKTWTAWHWFTLKLTFVLLFNSSVVFPYPVITRRTTKYRKCIFMRVPRPNPPILPLHIFPPFVDRETTEDIRVTVIPFYMGSRDSQGQEVFWWRYCIRLENMGDLAVQLRERHWRIFALNGTLETVCVCDSLKNLYRIHS